MAWPKWTEMFPYWNPIALSSQDFELDFTKRHRNYRVWMGCAPAKAGRSKISTSTGTPNQVKPIELELSPAFLLIYVIHGDGNYSFFDGQGVKKWANANAVREAIGVAEAAKLGEVVIFHQRSAPFLINQGANGI
jgi:hypothetical protein